MTIPGSTDINVVDEVIDRRREDRGEHLDRDISQESLVITLRALHQISMGVTHQRARKIANRALEEVFEKAGLRS